MDGFVVKLHDGVPPTAGALQVIINSPTPGAVWRRAGTTAWLNSGELEMGLPLGTYEIEFKDVVNWHTPEKMSVSLIADRTTRIQVAYRPQLDLSLLAPQLITAKPGDRVTIVLLASGASPISFQWKKNGVAIRGQTGTTLVLDPCQLSDDAVYTCAVSNPYITVESEPVRVVVNNGGAVLAYLLGLTANPAGLDKNGDGKVDVADALLEVRTTLPTAPAGPNPANAAKEAGVRSPLDWEDSLHARTYDLYLWKSGAAVPATPTAAGLTASQWTPTPPLDYGAAYQWQVVARGDAGTASGPVWSFTTEKAIRVLAPNGGETWTRGKTATFAWVAVSETAGTTARLELWHGGRRAAVLKDKSTSGGVGVIKRETVTVPATLTPASDYLVMAVSLKLEQNRVGAAAYDTSDKVLAIN
jgi:hypothetical protein